MGVKTRILYGFLLARSRPVGSLNTASNKVRADVAKKSFRVKLRVKVGTMPGVSVFSEEEVDRPVSGACLSGRRKEEEEMYHALVNEDDIVHVLTIPDIKVIWCCRCHLVADDGSTGHEHFHRLVNIYSYHRTLKLPTTLFRVYVRWIRRL